MSSLAQQRSANFHLEIRCVSIYLGKGETDRTGFQGLSCLLEETLGQGRQYLVEGNSKVECGRDNSNIRIIKRRRSLLPVNQSPRF